MACHPLHWLQLSPYVRSRALTMLRLLGNGSSSYLLDDRESSELGLVALLSFLAPDDPGTATPAACHREVKMSEVFRQRCEQGLAASLGNDIMHMKQISSWQAMLTG